VSDGIEGSGGFVKDEQIGVSDRIKVTDILNKGTRSPLIASGEWRVSP